MAASLSVLSKLSEQLNNESAKVNGIISRFNQSIASMNFGVTVWLQEPVLESDQHNTVQLGYTNVENEWQLAVRSEADSPQPLLKSSRNLRIGALDLLPKLKEAIERRVEDMITSIQKGADASTELVLELAAESLNRTVEELDWSVRAYNCLKNAKIQTVGELVQKTESDLLATQNFGRKSLTEVKETLASMGLSLGMKKNFNCDKAVNMLKVRSAFATARSALHGVRGLARETDIVILEHYDDLDLTHTKICQEIQQHVATCQSCKGQG